MSKSCPKRSQGHFFYFIMMFIKIAQNVNLYLGHFCTKICCQELTKIAQSGHTARASNYYSWRVFLVTTTAAAPNCFSTDFQLASVRQAAVSLPSLTVFLTTLHSTTFLQMTFHRMTLHPIIAVLWFFYLRKELEQKRPCRGHSTLELTTLIG